MLMKGSWDGMKMLSFLLVLMNSGTSCQANPEPAESQSTEIPPTGEHLLKAAKVGNLENVKDLVGKGVDVNYSRGKPILEAAKNGHFEVVKYLLEAGANPNGDNENRFVMGKPISAAAGNNHIDIINLLLEAGASVRPAEDGIALLSKAAKNGHLEAVQRLFKAGADPDHSYSFSFGSAAREGHLDIVKAFIKAGANVTISNGRIIGGAAREGHIEVVKTLLEVGVGQEILGNVLEYAAIGGHLDVVKLLLERGADPNYGYVLRRAAEHADVEVVRTLMEAGSIIKTESHDISPIVDAAQYDNPEVITLLVKDYGVDINSAMNTDYWYESLYNRYGKGWTAMHVSAGYGYSMMQQLIELGADINLQDDKGRTPLQVAIYFKRLSVVKDLLRFCPNMTIATNEGKTALDMARDLTNQNPYHNEQQLRLINALKEVIPLEIATTPFNNHALDDLGTIFLAKLKANATLKEHLRNNSVYFDAGNFYDPIISIQQERGRKEMAKVLEDHRCKMPDQDLIALGSEYLATCECVPGQGPKMTFIPIQEANLCLPMSPIPSEKGSSALLNPEKSAEMPREVTA